jgi:hypothetical protein
MFLFVFNNMQKYALTQHKCIKIYFIHFASININATQLDKHSISSTDINL